VLPGTFDNHGYGFGIRGEGVARRRRRLSPARRLPRSVFRPLLRAMLRRFNTLSASVLVVGALLACKKSAPTSTSEPQATPATPTVTGATPPAEAPKEEPNEFLTDLDLAKACNELPVKGTKAYDKAPGRIHPTIVFSRKNENDNFSKSYDSTLDGWKADAAKDYELVACVTAKSSTKVKECKFDSKTPVHYLDLEDASYEMVVYEAQTGKEVAKKSVDIKVDKDCPMIWMFKSERDVKQAEFTQALMGWGKQYVAPKAGAGGDDKAAESKTAETKAAPAKAPDLKTPAAKSDPKAAAKSDPKAAAKPEPPKAPAKTPPKPAPSKANEM